LFGLVLWSAAITSVTGSAYTSISFLQTLHPVFMRKSRTMTLLFITLSTLIFSLTGKPKMVLLLAGAINGFILPLSLSLMLLAAYRPAIVGDYKHPRWMSVFGWFVVMAMTYIAIKSLMSL
jgi:Mn2+/Fe2+ NRAMP family transporter